jgi:hypothetical protein
MLRVNVVLVEEKFLAKIALALWILFEDLLGVVPHQVRVDAARLEV